MSTSRITLLILLFYLDSRYAHMALHTTVMAMAHTQIVTVFRKILG
ncbi:MAG: hypothetical protein K1W22_14180 [Lachnospiraceae bacterium]